MNAIRVFSFIMDANSYNSKKLVQFVSTSNHTLLLFPVSQRHNPHQ